MEQEQETLGSVLGQPNGFVPGTYGLDRPLERETPSDSGDRTNATSATCCYQEVFERSPAGVVLVDPTGHVDKCNPKARQMLDGLEAGVVWRKFVESRFAPRPDDGHEVSLRNGRRLSVSTQALKSQKGQLVMMTDVTETRLLQQKLSHNARLVSVGETAAALAHQIRTPLAAALLNLPNLTAATGTESDRRRYAERIKTSLKHLSRLVEQMLMYSRAGTFTYQTVSIRELLDVHKDVFEGRIKQSGGELAVSSPTEDVQITGNFDALLTALQNLTNNALEAREIDCRVTIDIANQSDHIDINVKDNGPGIPSSELTNIFEPFYSHAKRGSGLGLAVVKTVATAHVGEVRVKNTVPEGCIFTLSLPKKLNKVPSAEIQENEAVV